MNILFKHYFFILSVGMNFGLLHSAQPLNKANVVVSIKKDFKDINSLLTQLATFSDATMDKALNNFDEKNLQGVRDFTQEFHAEMTKMLAFVKAHSAVLTPAKQVQSKLQTAGASIATAAAQHKTGAEGGKPAKLVTENLSDGYSMGTATGNLAAKSPKFDLTLKLGYKVTKLLEISLNKQALELYAPVKVEPSEIALLGQFANASNGKLARFVEYLKALANAEKLISFHRKFHTGTVSGNAYDAAQQMDMSQLTPLYALLCKLVK